MKIEERLGWESDFDLCICKRICDGACGFKRFGKIRDSSSKTDILLYETGVILGNKTQLNTQIQLLFLIHLNVENRFKR